MPHILVIDDEPSLREALAEAFTIQGHEVSIAADGQEGLDQTRNRRPDLLLLDLNMPRLNGFQVLETLKADPDLESIPVIILTAHTQQDQVVQGLELGANDYIGKPFNIQEVLARVRVQLRIQELEQKVRESETYHRALFERSSDPEMVISRSGNILQINYAAANLLDISPDLILSHNIQDLIHPDDTKIFTVAFSGAYDGSEIPIFECHLNLPDGRILPVDTDLFSVDIQGKRHLLLHIRDIRRRKSAEAQSSMIFEHIGDGVFITDNKGLILLASRSTTQLTGFPEDEIVGQDIARFHCQDSASGWADYLASSITNPKVYEGHFRQSNGYELPVEWTLADFQVGSESYLIGVVRDLSDRRDAEEERIESDRLQTLLEIAGGAAHEINQPLTAILGYAEMTESMLDDTHEVYIYQKHIIEATTRISEILKRMQEIREYRTRPYTSGYNIVDFSNQNENEADDLEP